MRHYDNLPPLLRKVEESVLGSNTGRSPVLAAYYSHWERAVNSAIVTMVVNGMKKLAVLLSARSAATVEDSSEGPDPPLLLFEVQHTCKDRV